MTRRCWRPMLNQSAVVGRPYKSQPGVALRREQETCLRMLSRHGMGKKLMYEKMMTKALMDALK